jgi:hypothetical protein
MTDETKPAERMAELSEETREFLSDLSREDIATIKSGLPVIRMIIGFGKVTKWLAITSLGLLVGTVMLWESVIKILTWLRPASPP